MSDEYIRKQDAVDYCKALMNAELVQNTDDWGYGKERYNQTEVILEFIENRQPADVVPVVHGRWSHIAYLKGIKVMECSHCGKRVLGSHNYCGNCGAKMDGEE